MKRLSISFLLLPALLALPACSGEEAQAKMSELGGAAASSLDNLKDIDLSKLGVDGMKEKVTELAGGLTDQLASVKDLASAEKVKEKIGPAIDMLSKLKDGLGDKMPSLSSLKSTVEGLTSKFAGDEGIMGVLKPLLDKLQSLIA